MKVIEQLRQRLQVALQDLTDQPEVAASQLTTTQDPNHGDYQANCAMSLARIRKEPSRNIAEKIVAKLSVEDICLPPQVAGPGFINFKLRDEYLGEQALRMLKDARLGVERVDCPRTVIVDFSSPNVAKPMHVGHIRSTVIGDAITKLLRFRGHRVITDNHLGDWGTQFGMIIYGYKHFSEGSVVRRAAVGSSGELDARSMVAELSRLYRVVNDLIAYGEAKEKIAQVDSNISIVNSRITQLRETLSNSAAGGSTSGRGSVPGEVRSPKEEKELRGLEKKRDELLGNRKELLAIIDKVQSDPQMFRYAQEHPDIGSAVLRETSLLHAGDAENVQLWKAFMPFCLDEIERIYRRLKIEFDMQLGESFYHDRLPSVVSRLRESGLATESGGAICIFLEGFDAPMIVQKQDGAFLYATTDLATLEYRQENYRPDEIVYVVDHRQGDHFQKLFLVAEKWGLGGIKLCHASFGTVLGKDGKPFKTRSGSSVGLESLLDDAVAEGYRVVCDPERIAKFSPPPTAAELEHISQVVGLGGIKYFDLLHHRTSDYVFDLQQMVSLDGNAAAYVQYAYARVQSLLRKAETTVETTQNEAQRIEISEPLERQLVLQLLRFSEAIDQSLEDYRPNLLVDYLYQLSKAFSGFFENCRVVNAPTIALRSSRVAIAALVGRVIKQGLELLGIDVVDRM